MGDMRFIDGKLKTDEMQSQDYSDNESELDMLVGFFFMNSFFVLFFFMFGLCVICSCLRRWPKFTWCKKKAMAASPKMDAKRRSIVDAMPQAVRPTFKLLVNKAIKSEEFKKKIEEAPLAQDERCESLEPNETCGLIKRATLPRAAETKLEIPSTTLTSQSSPNSPCNGFKVPTISVAKPPKPVPPPKPEIQEEAACPSAVVVDRPQRQKSRSSNSSDDEAISELEVSSLVRSNILGPLSFDDLYYT